MHARESDLLGPVRSFLESRGYAVLGEILAGGRRADLVGVGDSVVAVELELRDWRGALRQAMAYQLGAEYAWVAMPLAAAAVALRYRDRFEREGIGLLGVIGQESRPLLEPRPSARMLPPLQDTTRIAWTWVRASRSAVVGVDLSTTSAPAETAA